ncbi:MAG: VapC toxin family PIN domain ribonuclease [Burkholderiales bacterium]|nr:MAG: VapC toxin family PIN domain ribonuclease [Burkholderiales bacterium]
MVVVDTNIVAYLLIDGDRTRDVQALYSLDPEWKSEAFLLIEFSNILATYERSGDLTPHQADTLLGTAESRMRGLIALPHAVALGHARRFGVSANDARFLAVAEKLHSPLVTEDARLRAAAPSLTRSLAEALRQF